MFHIFFIDLDEEDIYLENTYYIKSNLSIGKIDDCEEELRDTLETISHRAIKETVKLYYDHTPRSICGLYCLSNILLKSNSEVITVQLLDNKIRWNDVEHQENEFIKLNIIERVLKIEQLAAMAIDWAILRHENANLRVSLNGQLVSVADTFYDDLILRIMDQFHNEGMKEIKMFDLFSRMLSYYRGIEMPLIEKRIKILIQTNKIDIVILEQSFLKTIIRLL